MDLWKIASALADTVKAGSAGTGSTSTEGWIPKLVWIAIGVPFWIFTGILIGPFQGYDSWSAVAGLTIWGKIIADFIIRLQAHPFTFGKKKKAATD